MSEINFTIPTLIQIKKYSIEQQLKTYSKLCV